MATATTSARRRDVRTTSLAIAGTQHGVVARRQLLESGVHRSSIDGQLGRSLFVLFPGVYAVGRPQISQEGLWLAGVLCAGHGAVLGYRSAASLWGLDRVRPAVDVVRARHRWSCRSLIDVAGRRGPVPLQVRRTQHLPDRHRAVVRGIPVTSVARTLLNLAAVMPQSSFERSFLEADRLGLIVDADLIDCLSRTRGRRGAACFRRMSMRRIPEMEDLRSVLEGLFLMLCRDEGIDRPETNVRIGPHEVDCVWRRNRLIVELDGYEFHRGLEKFEEDADRSSELRGLGWSTMRITWRMVTERPDEVATRVRNALAESLAPPGS